MILYNWLGGLHNQTAIFLIPDCSCNFDYQNKESIPDIILWFHCRHKKIKYICFLVTCSCIVSDMSCLFQIQNLDHNIRMWWTAHHTSQPESFQINLNSNIFDFQKILLVMLLVGLSFIYFPFLNSIYLETVKYFQVNFIPFFFPSFSL